MKLKDESQINEYMTDSLMYIQSNQVLNGVVSKLLLDGELYSHSVSVCKLSTQLAITYKFDDFVISNVNLAGLLHDVGKIYIPQNILYKPGRLTDEEFEIIKKHPLDGYSLLKDSGVNNQILKLVLNHHEKSDGSGYPNGIVTKTILEDIITTADIFSALTEHRVYHNALNICDAFSMINDFDNLNRNLISTIKTVISN